MMARENIQPYAERERHRTEQQPEALCGVRRKQHRRRAENAAGGIEHGNRLIMMHEGHIIYDVAGEEKQKLHVSDLLAKFQIASGGEFANDRMILSN